MVWAAAGVASAALVTGVHSSMEGKKGAKKQARKMAPMHQLQMQTAQRNNQIANRLDELATKMLEGAPISPAEENLFKRVQELTDKQIRKSTQQSMEDSMAAQAGTGFLKSGRSADQIRKLSLEGAAQRDAGAIERERTQLQMIEQRRQLALQTLAQAGGGAMPQFNTGLMGLPSETLNAAGLSAASGTLGSMAGMLGGGLGGGGGAPSGGGTAPSSNYTGYGGQFDPNRFSTTSSNTAPSLLQRPN